MKLVRPSLLLAVAAAMALVAPGTASAWWGPRFYGPAFVFGPPIIVGPPVYAPPPVVYAPQPYPRRAAQTCYAGAYICPLDQPAPYGGTCSCPTNHGRAYGSAQ